MLQWAAEKLQDLHRFAADLAKEVIDFSQQGAGGSGWLFSFLINGFR